MEEKLQLELQLLLKTEIECPTCAERLVDRLTKHKGVEKVHLKREDGDVFLCLHYDPDLVSLARLSRLAENAGSELSKRYRHETLHVTGMDCADCAASVEHIMGRAEGVIDVSVSYAAEKMKVEYDSARLSHEDIVQRVKSMGYGIEEPAFESWFQENWELVLALLSGIFLSVGFFIEHGGIFRNEAVALYALAYIAGGFNATRHAFKAAIHARFDIDFLMVTAALGAALVGRLAEGALLLFLFSLGHALEHYAMDRARHAIKALGKIAPKTAKVKRDGLEEEILVENLRRRDVVIVRAGERIPTDGSVIKGISSVDQSPITGESVPVEKSPGDDVFAGTVNGSGSMEIEVTKLAKDTTLARIIELVEEAQTQKSPTQRFAERLERAFVPLILAGVVVLIAVPPAVGILSWDESFIRAMTVLVAASPCALAIATPSAILSGLAQAARKGILIKGGVHLENLGEIGAMAFDKTGTLTKGEPEVTDLFVIEAQDKSELLETAASLENRSAHPLARAILKLAKEKGLDLKPADEVQTLAGLGLSSVLEGESVLIGNLKLFEGKRENEPEKFDAESNFKAVRSQVERLDGEGKTTVIVKRGKRFLGVIALQDAPRSGAKETLKILRSMGVNTLVMITGDNEQVAAAIAEKVGTDEQISGLFPEDKVEAVEHLLEKYGKVGMVGDGVNDAPALARATVGIAMGASGTDVALETADVALMADDLSKLPFAVALGRQSRKIIRQNLIISLGVIAVLVMAALSGLAGIGIAILFHEGSTLLVVANALRLLGYETHMIQ